MRLKQPPNIKTKTIGIALLIPLVAVISAACSATKIGIFVALAAVLAGSVAVMLLIVVLLMAYIGIGLLTGTSGDV